MAETTFEERLLPVLVEELQGRSQHRVRDRRRRQRALAASVVAAVTLLALVALVTASSSGSIINVTVTSPSMLPTFETGAVVAVDTEAYASEGPARGDIIAFRLAEFPQNIFIKRVIGLPGDVVEENGGVVSVNGTVLDEPYANLDHGNGRWTVEPGHLFVLGDNRPNSNDSRFTGEGGTGQVSIPDVVGKVLLGTTNGAADVPAGPAGVASGTGKP
jgi:signal peptidase I